MQSTLRTAQDLCTYVSITVLFGSNGNSYTVSTESDVCLYTHILHNIETLVGQKKLKIGTEVNAACHFGHECHWFVSPVVGYSAPVKNEDTIHQRTFCVRQTIRNRPGTFQRVRKSLIRRVHTCISLVGGNFEHLL
jgi:hypothetical protein